ncbi:MAG: hypothetical protein JNL62_05770 [Bryobacterales bacterium]|nr:hypothetical protein [Bryobacterales bacterium]
MFFPSTKNIPLQIAHLAGAFASAIQSRDKRMKHVYIDVSDMAPAHQQSRKLPLPAKEPRQIENNVAPHLRVD